MKKSTEVAKTKGVELAKTDDMEAMFAGDAGRGLENVDKDCFAIPFLTILQSGSPQCKKSDGAYIKGAEEGMLFNTVTKDLYDGTDGILFLPCAFVRRMVEWVPKEDGGGYRGDYSPAEAPSIVRDDEGNDVLPNGHHLVDTRYHYGYIVDASTGVTSVAVLAMAKTQLKKSKHWITIMDAIRMDGPAGKFNPPTYSHLYKITTVPESNDKGSWFGWNILMESPVSSASLYSTGKQLNILVREGKAKAAEPASDEVGGDKF